jgi:NADH-quinone oxidoreductase subunit N
MFADLFRSLGRPDVLDLAHQSHYFWALLPEIVLALGAMGVLMVDVFQKGNRSEPSRPNVAWLSILSLVLAGVANLALTGASDRSEIGMVAVDHFRLITNFIFLGSAAFTLFLSMGYLDRRGINRGEFHVLVLFATLGMMLMGGARDLMLLFVGLEVMSVAIYVLVGFDRLDPRSSEGSLKYFLLGAFSSAFFLYGLALVWGTTGTTNLRGIGEALMGGSQQFGAIFTAGMVLTMVGFAFKVAAMPFHMWTPDAYDGAPTPVTALMSTGVKAAAFAAFIRMFVVAFGGVRPEWAVPVYLLAIVTMFGANLIALTQGSVKRMLAYSSIAHAGYLMVALLAGNAAGVSAFLFYLVVYTVMTAGAFGIVIANSRENGEERVALEDWAGFASQKPLMAALFSVFLLSLAGFPLTAGFLGKMYILRAIVEARITSAAVLLVLASLISYFYYLRVIVVMYMRPARSADDHRHTWLPAPTRWAVTVAGVVVLALFFLGSVPLRWAQQGAATLWTPAETLAAPAVPAGQTTLR